MVTRMLALQAEQRRETQGHSSSVHSCLKRAPCKRGHIAPGIQITVLIIPKLGSEEIVAAFELRLHIEADVQHTLRIPCLTGVTGEALGVRGVRVGGCGLGVRCSRIKEANK
jgi:hypothetical protein